MGSLHFYKMHSAGNDFILIDNRQAQFDPENHVRIRMLCSRRTGIGADGLLLLEESATADFRLSYYNADGFPAEMCGNGARCAVYLAHRLKMAPPQCRFEIRDHIYEAETMPDQRVRLQMVPPRVLLAPDELAQISTGDFPEMMWLNTGVPHLVIRVNTPPEKLDVDKWGAHFRNHPRFHPPGTNVNFVNPVKPNHLRVRVYERGVEQETLACGTGAVACGVYAALRLSAASPVMVEPPGGTLPGEFSRDLTNVTLSGAVVLIYEGRISPEFFD